MAWPVNNQGFGAQAKADMLIIWRKGGTYLLRPTRAMFIGWRRGARSLGYTTKVPMAISIEDLEDRASANALIM